VIYFDNAATTIPNELLLLEYNRIEREFFANSTSIHKQGIFSSKILEESRKLLLNSLNLDNSYQAIFVSGATEANNLAIKGYSLRFQNRGKHIITTAVEHPSVLESFFQLRDFFGFEITILPVESDGTIDCAVLERSIRKDTILVSIMAVNNETGAINDIARIASIIKNYPKIKLHVDATQAVGKITLPYSQIDMFSLSAHKFGGLKGSGALLIKKNLLLLPIMSGGNQEYGYRSGTVDVPSAFACALATKNAINDMKINSEKACEISSFIFAGLRKNADIVMNSTEKCSPFIMNFSLKNKKASVVVEALSNADIMVSSLSACHSKKEKSSYVIRAMGRDDNLSSNTIRLSFWSYNTVDEAVLFLEALNKIVESIK
jgi:cysteine desulfurase